MHACVIVGRGQSERQQAPRSRAAGPPYSSRTMGQQQRIVRISRAGACGTREGRTVAFGVVLVIIGLIFLAESLGITEFGIRELWPLILIGIGAVILYERLRRAWRRRGQ